MLRSPPLFAGGHVQAAYDAHATVRGQCRRRSAAISDCPPTTTSPRSFKTPNDARSMPCRERNRRLPVLASMTIEIVAVSDHDAVRIRQHKIE